MAQADYPAIAALKNSGPFRDRVVIAVTKYAQYILTQPASTFKAIAWAKPAYLNPEGAAGSLYAAVAFDSVISESTVLANATDAQIQSAVEAAVTISLNF